MQVRKDVKSALAESFRELVLEKPVEKITIKEIADRTGVIRVTFYNHFQDKYEVLEWICNEELFSPAKEHLEEGRVREAVTRLFTALAEHRDFYIHASRFTGQNSFESILGAGIADCALFYIEKHGSGAETSPAWLTPQRTAGYIARSLGYLVLEWIRGGMQEDPAQMAQIYIHLSGWEGNE